jgi:hypothetical protein
MNRSTTLQEMAVPTEAAHRAVTAVRKGFVKGCFAVKNFDKKLTEAQVRRLYKIPAEYAAIWQKDGSLRFINSAADITVHPDGTAHQSRMGSHVIVDDPWEP